jgi:hypothetical protein
MKKIFIILLLIASFSVSADPYQDYEEADNEVGCNSKYGKEKQIDLFNSLYKGKTFQWRGEIVNISSNQISLNLDGKIATNLKASFSQPKAGYELTKGQTVTLQFVMNSAGGCFIPFVGVNAEVLPNQGFYDNLLSFVGL